MRERGRIDNDEIDLILLGLLNALNQVTFMIALKGVDTGTGAFRLGAQLSIDLGQRLMSINIRLALPEQIQIGTM